MMKRNGISDAMKDLMSSGDIENSIVRFEEWDDAKGASL
jgi:hypothetical protein